MIGRRINLILLLFATILAAASCRRNSLPGDGYGGIVLSLNSSHALRMETKTDADDLLDGSRFSNVLVILTDNSGKVVGSVYNDYLSPQTEDLIEFDHLLPGNYHAYAYGNIDATQWQQTGANLIASKEKVLSAGSSFSDYLDRELLGLTTAGRDAPASPVTSMLLTGKMDIPVGLSVVETELDLLRPVVRFKVTVRNNTRFPVVVNDLYFSQFNPDKGYLLDHLDASGIPSVPAGTTYRDLPAFDSTDPSATVAAMSDGVVYTTYLYENVAPDPYKIFSIITLDRSGEGLSDLSYYLGAKPFGPIDAATLNAMADGETVDVLVVNPQINKRYGRIMCGINNNKIVWESAGYDNYNAYFSRAKAIYDEVASFTYTGYTYSSSVGYSSWNGVDTTPSTSNTFDYTGKRSVYFHTLEKTGNTFTLHGLAVNPSTETEISNISFTQGAPVNNKNPQDIPEGAMLRMKVNGTSNRIYVDASNMTETIFAYKTDGDTGQDRQYLFFGKFDDPGAALKRILTQNNKEVPLTYMARNEEINVILNVFYSDQDGTLVFEVDNDHWTDDQAVESEHTFN